MRVFFRYLFFLIFVVAAVLLISPYFIGRSVDKNYPKMAERFINAKEMSVKVLSIDKGWFSSTVKLEVTSRLSGSNRNFKVVFDQKVHHGFIVPYTDSQGKHWTFAFASIVYHSEGSTGSPLNISGVWNFGSVDLYASAKNYEKTFPGFTFKIKNLVGQLNFSNSSGLLVGAIAVDNFEATLNKGPTQHLASFSLANVTAKLNFAEKNHLWFGHEAIHIGDVALQADGKRTDLKDFNLTTRSNPSGGKIHTNISVTLQSLASPKFTLKDLEFSLSVNNIDIKAVRQLAEKSKVAKTQAQMMQLMPLVINVVTKGFDITLDKFYVKTNMGVINVSGKLDVPQSNQGANLQAIMQSLTANVEASAPRSIYSEIIQDHFEKQRLHLQQQMQGNVVSVEQLTHQAINQWIKNNMFIVSGDSLEMKVQFARGKVMINGLEPNFALPKPQQQEQPPLPGTYPDNHKKNFQMHDVTPEFQKHNATPNSNKPYNTAPHNAVPGQ